MSLTPLQRFLGLDERADDRTLLGLDAAPISPERVRAALEVRLSRLARHPAGGSDEAEAVRRRLREAAARLLGGAAPVPPRQHPASRRTVVSRATPAASAPTATGVTPARPDPAARPTASPALVAGPVRHRLTPFDRLVMAVLVGSGGWNARSRELLVALAAQHQVSVKGLTTVIAGLAEHIRAVGARPNAAELSGSISMALAQRPQPTPSRVGQALEVVQSAVADELRGQSVWSRVRLSVVFGILVLALGAVFVKLLLLPQDPRAEPRSVVSATPDQRRSEIEGSPDDAATPTGTDSTTAPRLLARFPSPPGFRGTLRTESALHAQERSATIASEIELLGRKLALAGELAEADAHAWEAAIADAGACWPLLELPRRRAILDAIVETMRGVSTASAAGTILAAFDRAHQRSDEGWIWRTSFNAGVLGMLVRRAASLSPAVVERAAQVGGAAVQPVGDGFESAAARRLEEVADMLVARLPADEHFADHWEQWIEAVRAVHRTSATDVQGAFVGVMERLLRGQADLSREGQSSDLLGRMIELANFETSPVVREAVTAWLADQSISSNNLWVLTSLMSQKASISWFESGCVVDWDADEAARTGVRESMLARWHIPEQAALVPIALVELERSVLDLWTSGLDLVQGRAAEPQDEISVMVLLARAAELNEAAACFVAGQIGSGTDLARSVQAHMASPGALMSAGDVGVPPLVGSPRGRDGEWSAAYALAQGNTEARLQLLRQLRFESGGDLGTQDAEVLIRETLRGSPAEIRSVARAVVAETYAYGPRVMLELLDQLPDAPVNEELAQLISRLTDEPLPALRSDQWAMRARVAMARWTLSLLSGARSDAVIDAITDDLRDCLQRRIMYAGSDAFVTPQAGSAGAAMTTLVEAWRQKAAHLVVAAPIPGELADLDRRRGVRLRLAEGVVTRFVAEQVTHLELAAYTLTAQLPWMRDGALRILEDSALARVEARHVLEQALEAELALARIWRMALTAREPEPAPRVGRVGDVRPLGPDGSWAVPEGEAPGRGDSRPARRPIAEEPIDPPTMLPGNTQDAPTPPPPPVRPPTRPPTRPGGPP